jgi:hypothetical protein
VSLTYASWLLPCSIFQTLSIGTQFYPDNFPYVNFTRVECNRSKKRIMLAKDLLCWWSFINKISVNLCTSWCPCVSLNNNKYYSTIFKIYTQVTLKWHL